MIVAIGDEQETSMMIECQAQRRAEQAISKAFLLDTNRELDSSITIKSIVSHLFHFNLSLTTTKRCSKLQIAQTKEMKRYKHCIYETRERERHQASKQASNEQQEATRTNR